MFADRGSCVRCRSFVFAAVRSVALLPCRWAALTKCDKICWSWISSQIAWFCGVLRHALGWLLRVAWQAQYFGSVSMLPCCVLVAGAALCDVAR